MMGKRGYKRGYPVAVLVGLEANRAVLWQVFSKVVKPYITLSMGGLRSNAKAVFRFHEAIVVSLRPILKAGVKSIVLAAPARTDFAQVFLEHIDKHHPWLSRTKGSNCASFGVLIGSAGDLHEVADLVKAEAFCGLVSETTSTDADRVVEVLEKWLNKPEEEAKVLYSIKEVEDWIYNQPRLMKAKFEYLMLTNEYLQNHKEKNRINRLLQVSNNRNVKTVIVDADTRAGKRLMQLGGLVFFASLFPVRSVG